MVTTTLLRSLLSIHSGGGGVVTDMCLPDALVPVELEKIIATAEAAEPKLRKLIRRVLAHEAANSAEKKPSRKLF